MRRGIVTAVLGATFASFAPTAMAAPGGAHGDVLCRAHGKARGGVALLHPGSFWIGATAPYLRRYCRPFVRAGFDAVGVDYPVRDFFGALAHVRRTIARLGRRERHRPVFAFGESAGGTFATLLAVRGVVPAIAVAPVTNLVTWHPDNVAYWHDVMHMSLADRRAGSPLFLVSRHPKPLLVLHSPRDRVVPFAQSTALGRRVRPMRLARLHGGHLADRSSTPRAIGWLLRRAPGFRARARG